MGTSPKKIPIISRGHEMACRRRSRRQLQTPTLLLLTLSDDVSNIQNLLSKKCFVERCTYSAVDDDVSCREHSESTHGSHPSKVNRGFHPSEIDVPFADRSYSRSPKTRTPSYQNLVWIRAKQNRGRFTSGNVPKKLLS